jgi:uncharacterized membrane protein YhaH (DUF805 family)
MNKPKFFLNLPALLSIHGRISRLQYFVYSLFYIVFCIGLYFAAAMILAGLGYNVDAPQGTISDISSDFTLLIFYYVFVCLAGKRMHDLGWSAWFAVLMFVDIPTGLVADFVIHYIHIPAFISESGKIVAGIWRFSGGLLGITLTFGPGMKGANKFGPDPLRPPQPEISVF